MKKIRSFVALTLLFLISPACIGQGDFETNEPISTVKVDSAPTENREGLDWPQWRGPDRDGISVETGLLHTWPPEGPREIWRSPLGEGYSGIAVVGERLFTLFQTDAEYLVALDSTSGEELWRTRSDAPYSSSQGDGPRGTPTVHDGMVYSVGSSGAVLAVEEVSGRLAWTRHLVKDLGGTSPEWAYATSPLVVGELLLVEPGGEEQGTLAALDRTTGELAWRTFKDKAGYSSAILTDMNGTQQIIHFSGTHLISARPADGKLLWSVPWETSYDVNAATPIFIPPNRVFVSSGYGVGGAVFEVSGESEVSEVWKNREMKNQFSSSVYFEGHLYGFDDSTFKCLNAANGEMLWRQRGLGRGSLILADGQLIVLGDKGQLVLVEATPEAYLETARAQVLKGKCWTSPSLSNGRLYLRNQKEIVCLDLSD